MRFQFHRLIALGSAAFFAACSSTSGAPSSSVAGAGGQAGADPAAAGASAAGASGAGAPSGGSSGSSAGGAGAGGSAGAAAGAGGGSGGSSGAAGSGGSGGATTQMNFTCTEYLGLLTTNEWYSQGFEADGVDPAKWELKYHHFGYVRTWADPNSAFWGTTGNSFDLNQGSSLQSPCTTNPDAPDRLVFAALDWEMASEGEWVTALESALVTFKGKYPSLRQIDLMTMIRCPANSKCNPNANYGPGANGTASRQDCFVPDFEDSAIAKVAANHPGYVSVGPKVEADACRNPVDGAHLSVATNKKAAQAVATYYAAHP